MIRYLVLHPRPPAFYPFGNLQRPPWTTSLDSLYQQCLFHNLPPIKCPASSSSLCPARSSSTTSKNIQIYFLPSQPTRLLALANPCKPGCRSFRFYPPHCYQASLAGISSLLRIHLPPHTASDCLESPLDFSYPISGTVQGFPG